MSEITRDIAYLSDIEGVPEQQLDAKADKVSGATAGHFAGLNAQGNLVDSGKSPSDYYTKAETDALVGPLETALVAKAGKTMLAPEYNPNTTYEVGQLAIKDGKLQQFTNSGATGWQEVTVGGVIDAVKDTIPSGSGSDPTPTPSGDYVPISGGEMTGALYTPTLGAEEVIVTAGDENTNVRMAISDGNPVLESTSGGSTYTYALPEASGTVALDGDLASRAMSDAVDSTYNAAGTYAEGDTCMHNGMWYKCTVAIPSGEEWSDAHWTPATVADAIREVRDSIPDYSGSDSETLAQIQADWDEQDNLKASFIRNKPKVYFTEAEVVGGALADRTVNVVSLTNVEDGFVIRLTLPPVPGTGAMRDFYVVFDVTTSGDVGDVSVVVSGAVLYDSWGDGVSLAARSGRRDVLHFMEMSGAGEVFMVTGANDPAYAAVKQIEQAVDALLADAGTIDYTPSIHVYNREDGKYYEIGAVTDPDMGVVIAVDQEGKKVPGSDTDE
jgi:hypothetical protein